MSRVNTQVCIAYPYKVVNKFDHSAQHNLFEQIYDGKKKILTIIDFYDTNYTILFNKKILETWLGPCQG